MYPLNRPQVGTAIFSKSRSTGHPAGTPNPSVPSNPQFHNWGIDGRVFLNKSRLSDRLTLRGS
jgi:hypothetical protein